MCAEEAPSQSPAPWRRLYLKCKWKTASLNSTLSFLFFSCRGSFVAEKRTCQVLQRSPPKSPPPPSPPSPKMTIDVYYTMLSPPARSVLVVAKHLGLAVTPKEVDLFAGGTRTPEYLKMNPSHTVPTLDDNGFVLFESRAILAYLVNKYSPNHGIYPEDPQIRAAIDKVLFFDASAIFPAIRGIVVPKVFKKIEVPAEAVAELKEKVEIVEAILGDQRFLAGENVTLADISFGVEVPMIKVLYPSFISPKLQAWYDRTLRDVPALEEYNSQADYSGFLKKF